MYHYDKARTQKARGVLLACPVLQESLLVPCIRPDYVEIYSLAAQNENNKSMLFSSMEDVIAFTVNNPNFWAFGKSVFARPCPLTPRHGFVDSKVINSHAALIATFEQIKSVDPHGELILMGFIGNAVASSVLTTSGLLSIGPGHAGATSGYRSIMIPVKPDKLSDEVMKLAGLSENDTAFLEAVYPRSVVGHEIPFQITQIRGGPAVAQVTDFVPYEVEVKSVVTPHPDLLTWESMTKSFIPGTVVHGEGHSLASHAAIHCVINNIPFITSYEPKVGQVIEAVVAGNQPLNREEFLRGVHASLKKVFSLDVMLHISASILHNWTFIRTSPEASWLLGVAASYITQVLLALCFGEFRHAKKKIASFSNLVSTGMGRTDVYKNVVNPSNFLSSLRKAPTVSRGFVDKKNFPKKEFGGIKWARATNMAIKIWNSIITIQNRGISNVNINRLISNINKATHLVHNGGWLFNKVSVPEKLDKISNQPNLALFELSDYVFEVYEEYLKVDEKLKSVKSLKQIKVRTNK